MTSITLKTNALEAYTPPESSAQNKRESKPSAADDTAQAEDTVQLSAATREVAQTGRVALNLAAGNLTSDQATQLYGQIAAIHTQIATDRQAGGGTLSSTDRQSIQQQQNQLSQAIFSDAHNGASPPADADAGLSGARLAVEAGRVTLNENAGNLSSDQAGQLVSQIGTIHQQIAADKQANGGSLNPADARTINQLENQLSQQIYNSTHGATNPLEPAPTNQG